MFHAHSSLRLVARWRRAFALVVAALTLAVLPIATASANYLYTPYGGARLAMDFVSKHYANTYVSDLSADCYAQGMATLPGYKYHRLVCYWYDSSDGTSGTVLIIGSNVGPGAYYGRVLRGAHY